MDTPPLQMLPYPTSRNADGRSENGWLDSNPDDILLLGLFAEDEN